MQIRFQYPPLQYELDIDKLIHKLRTEIREEREREMVANEAQTLMDYPTPTLRETNTI